MATNKDFGSERDVPTWNGIEDGWNIYLEECEWFFWATPPKDRHLVASKLARRLTGSARTAIRGLHPRDFAGTQGIPKLLRLLQGRIGDLPIPDLANKLDEFIFRLKRTPGESMNEWGLRSIESYRKLQVALDRVKGKKADLGDYNYEYTEDKTQDRERGKGRYSWPTDWAKGEEDEEPLETEEDEVTPKPRRGKHRPPREEPDEAESLRGFSRTGSEKAGSTKSASKKAAVDKDELELDEEDGTLFPTEVRGWLLLRNSGLSYAERSTILASTQGVLKFEVIFRSLRASFPPRDLKKIDQQRGNRLQGKGKGKYGSLNHVDGLGDLDWDPTEEEPTGWSTSQEWHDPEWETTDWDQPDWGTSWGLDWDNQASAWSSEGQEWGWGSWEWEEESYNDDPALITALAEAYAAQQEHTRTLQQARAAIQQSRTSRGFSKGPPGKGKGKGKSKGGKSKGKFKGKAPGKMQGKGPCFVCGGPHMAAACPDRTAPKAANGLDALYIGRIYMADVEPYMAEGLALGEIPGPLPVEVPAELPAPPELPAPLTEAVPEGLPVPAPPASEEPVPEVEMTDAAGVVEDLPAAVAVPAAEESGSAGTIPAAEAECKEEGG